MPRPGDIHVRITADDSDFKRKIRSFNQKMASVRRGVNRSAIAFGALAAAGTAAGVAIVNSQRKTIDALAKSADALAITTEKLQALNHLAELNGVSSEQMAKGLRRMERALGEAARKGGTTADALEDAGISIQSIINLEPDQQIQKIANALGGIENQAVKASIASDLFGRDGINMLKVLTQLRKDGIEPTTEKLAKLGISISRIDAAKVEAANDAFFTAQQVLGGIGKTITVELAPFIEELSNQFVDAARESGGFGEEVREAMENGIRIGAKFADFLQGLRVTFKALELGVTAFGAAGATMLQIQMKALTFFVDGAIGQINLLIDGVNKLTDLDIARIDYFGDSVYMRGLNAAAGGAREKIALLSGELHELAMQELPSDQVEQFLETVKQKSAEAAQSVAAVATGNISGGGGDGNNVIPFKGPTPGSVNTQSDEFGFGPMEDPFDPEQIAAKNEELLQLDRDFWTNKGAIADHGLTAITGMIESSQGKQAGAYANSFASILGSTATYSKKAFELNKKFALGEAVVKGYQSATAAWSAGMSTGGPQAPFVAAAYMAASIAKTGAQIKAIKAQSFGGGGSGSAGGGTGGSAGAIPGASVPQQSNTPQRANTAITVNLQGDSFSRGGVEALFETINNGLEDGYSIRVAS